MADEKVQGIDDNPVTNEQAFEMSEKLMDRAFKRKSREVGEEAAAKYFSAINEEIRLYLKETGFFTDGLYNGSQRLRREAV